MHVTSEATPARWLNVIALCLLVTLGCDDAGPCRTELLAQMYNPTTACLGLAIAVGCTAATSCDDSLAWALDPYGTCYLFPSSCVPAKFTPLSPGDPRCPSVSDSLPMCGAR
jgi:hypothetical protein